MNASREKAGMDGAITAGLRFIPSGRTRMNINPPKMEENHAGKLFI
jgi:hypothetical protein